MKHRVPNHIWMSAMFRVVLCSLVLVQITSMQVRALETNPADMVEQLMVAVNDGAEQERESLVASLPQSGESALPAIAASLATASDEQRLQLARVLGGIGGDESTSLLVEMLSQRQSFPRSASRALSALVNRMIRRELSIHELEALRVLILQSRILEAGSAARVLANSTQTAITERMSPITERFKSEMEEPSEIAGRIPGTFLSPQTFARNQFLLAFASIGKQAVPSLTAERQSAAVNTDVKKWWILALGMATDSSAVGTLQRMVQNEPDRYIRCLAVRAYARAAGEGSIPTLESLLGDQTKSEYNDSVPLIAKMARDELTRLRSIPKAAVR